MKSILTRFRAYQLGSPGSSFSYFADGHFTLIEGRLTELTRVSLEREMTKCGVETADTLHITSWDEDHCCSSELEELLDLVRPEKIECPGYEPGSENGEKSLAMIRAYKAARRSSNRAITLEHITPEHINTLDPAENLGFNHIFYNPLRIDADCSNDNSTVKFFRSGSFNVLSLGDVESQLISARLRRARNLRRETDVMILAHHGADNGFTNKKFINHIEPQLAICSADYDNVYDHPRDEIRELLYEHGIRIMTTKTGDVIVRSIDGHNGRFQAINLKSNSTEISSQCDFSSKKAKLLSYNADTIRQLYGPRPSYPKR